MRRPGISAYAALSVNIHMLAYEQAPRQSYSCFHSQPRLCLFQAFTQSIYKKKKIYFRASAYKNETPEALNGEMMQMVQMVEWWID